jgi:hypothetical protein
MRNCNEKTKVYVEWGNVCWLPTIPPVKNLVGNGKARCPPYLLFILIRSWSPEFIPFRGPDGINSGLQLQLNYEINFMYTIHLMASNRKSVFMLNWENRLC